MNIEAYRELGMEFTGTPEGTKVHLDRDRVHERVLQLLCDFFEIEPHSHFIYSASTDILEFYRKLSRIRVKKDGWTQYPRDPRPIGSQKIGAETIYTADLPYTGIPKPDYVIFLHKEVSPDSAFAYPLMIAHEITHGEHACFHIDRTLQTHREYDGLGGFHLEYIAYLGTMHMVLRLGVLDQMDQYMSRVQRNSMMHAIAYDFARGDFENSFMVSPDNVSRGFISKIFRSSQRYKPIA